MYIVIYQLEARIITDGPTFAAGKIVRAIQTDTVAPELLAAMLAEQIAHPSEGSLAYEVDALPDDFDQVHCVEDGQVVPCALVHAQDVLHVMINRDRERRMIAGKMIDGINVTGRDEDARNLTNLAMAAQLRLASGDNVTLTTFRDGDNIDHSLTPVQVLSLWQQSAAYVSALYAASWALKAMDPIPQDFTHNSYWPGD